MKREHSGRSRWGLANAILRTNPQRGGTAYGPSHRVHLRQSTEQRPIADKVKKLIGREL